ncbi:MAG: hypothetical protein H6Q30_2112 [Bacteroidetes bacterium]|nr:hypothetical protein [Bacteroidota bacterium]
MPRSNVTFLAFFQLIGVTTGGYSIVVVDFPCLWLILADGLSPSGGSLALCFGIGRVARCGLARQKSMLVRVVGDGQGWKGRSWRGIAFEKENMAVARDSRAQESCGRSGSGERDRASEVDHVMKNGKRVLRGGDETVLVFAGCQTEEVG